MFKNLLQKVLTGMNEPLIARIKKRPFYHIIIFLLIVNSSLVAINTGLWFIAAHQNLFIFADFTSFYSAFKIVMEGDGPKLYDLEVQAKYQQEIMGDFSFDGGVLPYLNPPIVALVLSPLSLFSLNEAFYIWTLGQLGLLIWLIFLVNRTFSHWSKQERITLTLTLLSFWPLTITFILGQFTLIILISIIQIYIAIKDFKLNNAGLWFIMLIIKPHFAFIPSMITLNKRFWRVAFMGLLIGIPINIIPGIFFGFKPYIQYIQLLGTVSNYFGKIGLHPDIQYTLRGILLNLFGDTKGGLINTVSIIFLVLGMIIIWRLWMHGEAADSSRNKLYFAFSILLSCLLSMHSYPYDDLILVLPAALFYDYLRQNNYPKKLYTVFIMISPLIFFIAAFTSFNLFGIFRPPVILIMVFLVWMIYYLYLDHRQKLLATS
jgi:hypothetical protein